jgi:hypothetical protein
MIRKKTKKKTTTKTYLIGWVLQFTLSNLLNDNWVFLPQIHFDGIEIDEVDNWESTKKKTSASG